MGTRRTDNPRRGQGHAGYLATLEHQTRQLVMTFTFKQSKGCLVRQLHTYVPEGYNQYLCSS